MNKSILVVAAHPDDEVLGCGGTIATHAANGDQVQVLIVAEGATSRHQSRDRNQAIDELSALEQAAKKAGVILGAHGVELMDLPDNRLDSIDRLDLIKQIEERIACYESQVVNLSRAGDVNVDHRPFLEAVITACRPTPLQPVERLLGFEVPSSTEWQHPVLALVTQRNWFVEITAHWSRQFEALSAYVSEMRPWPHARLLEVLEHVARWRGVQVGCEAGEEFCLLRHLE